MKAGNWILVAGIFAFLGVALGAFGAHALADRFGEYEKGVWHTAVLYHLIHALALFAFGVGLAVSTNPGNSGTGVQAIGWLFSVGIFLFSGSLYALALSGVKVLGAVTPLGGLAFLAAWALVARAGYQIAQQSGN